MSDHPGLNDWLRPIVQAVVREVLAECGQSNPPQLYDTPTAAKMLSIPERWLKEHTANDSIPCCRIGKYVRFTDADLRAIVERKPS